MPSITSSRKPHWRPSSVGIGSSLTLSGNKPADKEKGSATGTLSVCFPRVLPSERRLQSAPRTSESWKGSDSSLRSAPVVAGFSPTFYLDDGNYAATRPAPFDNTTKNRWIRHSEYCTSANLLFHQKNIEETDRNFLVELDSVRRQIKASPEQLMLSIKAVMTEKRKCTLTTKAVLLSENMGDSPSKEMLSMADQSQQIDEGLPAHGQSDSVPSKVTCEGLPTSDTGTYHAILKAAIDNNCSNSSSVNAFVNSSEPYSEGDNSNVSRQTSSSSSTSLPLERKNTSQSHSRHKNGITLSHDRHVKPDTLPIVCTDENANTSIHTLPLNSRLNRSQQAMQPSTSINFNPKSQSIGSTSKTQRINSLSISGIKQDGGSPNPKGDDTPEEEEPQMSQLQIHDRLPSKPPPPSLHHYSTTTPHLAGATTTTSPSTYQSTRRRQPKTHLISGRQTQGKQKADPEPKYADPIVGATHSFQSRLAELASLEAETVRWERLRKLKKKNRERDD